MTDDELLRKFCADLRQESATDMREGGFCYGWLNKAAYEIGALLDERAALLDRLQAAERDAARYRWLRDGQNPSVGLHRADVIYMQHKHGAELDAAIDAAQGAQDTPGDA